jgi:hypothetical protein
MLLRVVFLKTENELLINEIEHHIPKQINHANDESNELMRYVTMNQAEQLTYQIMS